MEKKKHHRNKSIEKEGIDEEKQYIYYLYICNIFKCIYIYIYIYIYTHTHTHTERSILCVFIFMSQHILVKIMLRCHNKYISDCKDVQYEHVIYIYIYNYVCICVGVYYIYIYIYTYIYA